MKVQISNTNYIPTGIQGMIQIEIPKSQWSLWSKVRKMYQEQKLDITFSNASQGSFDQTKALYVLLRAIALSTHGEESQSTLEAMKYSLYEEFAPRITLNDGKEVPLHFSDMDRYQRSKFLDHTIAFLMEAGVEAETLSDVAIIVKEHRMHKSKTNTHNEKEMILKDYVELINYCEACGQTEGLSTAHIQSRGSGGSDMANNLLRLCDPCHVLVQHQKGWEYFINTHPHLERKIRSALEGEV